MRAFISVPLPQEVKKVCKEIEEKLKKTGVKMKLVEPENLHITLKFLGEIDDSILDTITRILDNLDFRQFKARTSFVGCFPNPNFIRVVWLGVDSKELVEMQKKIDGELEKLGFTPERAFIPHITLARVKEKPNKKLKELIGIKNCVEFEVDSVQLMKSTLTREGPVYEVLHEKKV